MDSDVAAGSRSPDAAGSRRPTKRQARSLPDRAMLDCYLRPLRHHDNSTLVYVSTATGGKIGVGLVAATPPKVSYLLYHWIADEGRRGSSHKAPEIPSFGEAKAMAAHRNSILLSFLFPMNKGGTFPDMSEEFFVYQATVVPTLKKLPACHHTFRNCDTTKNSGILCRESGGLFVVAHLNVHSERRGRGDYRVTAELCRIFGEEEAGPWHTTKCVPICLDESQRKDLIWWETDAVIPFGDFICWVDYLRGILFCNVFSQDHPEVKFVPLPISPYPGSCHPDLDGRGALSAYRSVCVTKDGESMKFIDVGHLDCWFHGRQRGVPRPPIKSWTLTSERLWREDVMMEEADFFALIMDNRLLTHSQMKDIGLVSPFVHMRDPEIIYLVLEGGPQPCLLEVNMKSRTMNTVPSCKIASFGSSYMHSNSTSFGLCHYEQPLPLSLAAPNITTVIADCALGGDMGMEA